jgi:hypothetical protein
MRKKCSHQAALWDLFRPPPQRPIWSNLPTEVRQKATRLLARLLRQHRTQDGSVAQGKEAGDDGQDSSPASTA